MNNRPNLAGSIVAAMCTTAVVLFTLSSPVRATEDPPASQPTLVDVSDKAAVDAAMDKDVELDGVVKSADWSTSGKVLLIKFEKADDSKVMAAMFQEKREAMDKAFSGDVAKALMGAHVRIKGKLKDFKGHPEVVISRASQITIVEAGPTTQPADK